MKCKDRFSLLKNAQGQSMVYRGGCWQRDGVRNRMGLGFVEASAKRAIRRRSRLAAGATVD
eukprot:5645586-Pleurochrysis_carterae.AAC.1